MSDGIVSDGKYSLNHVTLNIEKGSFVSIIGANGSGKSTLARHLNGLLQPEARTIYIDGMDAGDEKNILKIRQTCGMVFQNPDNQLIGSTVEEDVAFGLENLCFPSGEIKKRVMEALSKLHMEAYGKQSTHQLSGGQKQKVAIASTIAMQSACIVLDEATAMLEPRSRREVMDCIRELNQKYGITIILITHHMAEAASADYVYAMKEGRIEKEGTPKEVFSDPTFLEEIGLDVPEPTRIAIILKKKGMLSRADILTEEELVNELRKKFQHNKGKAEENESLFGTD